MTNLFTKIKNTSENLKTKLNDTVNHFGRRRVAVVGASVCVLLLAGGITTAVALSGGFDGVNPDNSTINKTVKVEKHQGDANLDDDNNETSDNAENSENNSDGNNGESNNDGSIVTDNSNSDNSNNTSNISNSNGRSPSNNGGSNAAAPSGTGNSGGSAAHVHTWTTVHHDAVIHQEPVYKWVSYLHCNLCGYESLNDNVFATHADKHIFNNEPWSCSNRVVQEITGYNQIIDSIAYDEKYCTSCGARG